MLRNPPYLIPIAIISILTSFILMNCEERKDSTVSIAQFMTVSTNAPMLIDTIRKDGVYYNRDYDLSPITKDEQRMLDELRATVHVTMEPKEPVKVKKEESEIPWLEFSGKSCANEISSESVKKVMRKLWSKEDINHPNCGNMKEDYEYPIIDLSYTDMRTRKHHRIQITPSKRRDADVVENPNIKWLGQVFNGYECGLHPDGFMVWREASKK